MSQEAGVYDGRSIRQDQRGKRYLVLITNSDAPEDMEREREREKAPKIL